MKNTYNLILLIFGLLLSSGSFSQGLYDYYLSQVKNKYFQKDYEGANYFIERGKSTYPDSMAFYRQGGEINYFLKDYRGVVSDINKAFELGCEDPYAYMSRAVALHNLKVLDSAKLDYQNFLQTFPQDTFALINIGILEFEKKNLNEAKNILIKYFNDGKFEFPRKQIILTEIYIQEINLDSTLWIASEMIKIDDSNLYAHKILGQVYEEKGVDSMACKHYLRAFELGDYSVKSKFDSFGCFEILDMDDEESPYSYPPPPPMEVIIKEK